MHIGREWGNGGEYETFTNSTSVVGRRALARTGVAKAKAAMGRAAGAARACYAPRRARRMRRKRGRNGAVRESLELGGGGHGETRRRGNSSDEKIYKK